MTLWVMARSPLMFGGHLPDNDDFTLGLLTNDEVLRVLKASKDNRPLFQQGDQVAWRAKSSDSDDTYLALFNIGDQTTTVETDLAQVSSAARFDVRDLWGKTNLGTMEGKLSQQLAPHAASLFRLRPA